MYFQPQPSCLSKIAVRDTTGEYTYLQLWEKAQQFATYLLTDTQASSLEGARVAFQALPTAECVAMLWGTWLTGGIAVPVSLSYPAPEVLYLLQNAQASHWIINQTYQPLAESIKNQHTAKVHFLENITFTPSPLPILAPPLSSPALMIYTSGTTGKPKGAVLTHENLQSQIQILIKAWEWTSEDYTLHALPLHHIHGVVNVLLCGLCAGATIDFLPKFEAGKAWELFEKQAYTLFMAVPTVYNRLIDYWNTGGEFDRMKWSASVRKMRLMVSGSAALPTTTLEKWQQISGHFLLERYGMTEIGMAISNPLHGVRKAGSVGVPLEGVEVRLIDDQNHLIDSPETAGEVQVRSKNVFLAYWQKHEATAESFTDDGWFKTGDVAQRDADGYYYLLGRNSTDILKTGGYKVSALEIEEVLLQHAYIKECAVIGLPDADWGDKVVAVVVWKNPLETLNLQTLREWAKQHLAPYKVPMELIALPELPRNAMGKVVKGELKKIVS